MTISRDVEIVDQETQLPNLIINTSREFNTSLYPDPNTFKQLEKYNGLISKIYAHDEQCRSETVNQCNDLILKLYNKKKILKKLNFFINTHSIFLRKYQQKEHQLNEVQKEISELTKKLSEYQQLKPLSFFNFLNDTQSKQKENKIQKWLAFIIGLVSLITAICLSIFSFIVVGSNFIPCVFGAIVFVYISLGALFPLLSQFYDDNKQNKEAIILIPEIEKKLAGLKQLEEKLFNGDDSLLNGDDGFNKACIDDGKNVVIESASYVASCNHFFQEKQDIKDADTQINPQKIKKNKYFTINYLM